LPARAEKTTSATTWTAYQDPVLAVVPVIRVPPLKPESKGLEIELGMGGAYYSLLGSALTSVGVLPPSWENVEMVLLVEPWVTTVVMVMVVMG
jgi:hypothetical protein